MNSTPVKLVKKDVAAGIKELQPQNSASKTKHEKNVQLIKVSEGIFDISMTCSCGEVTTVRCNSADVEPVPQVSAPTPAKATPPAVTPAPALATPVTVVKPS